MRKLILSSRLLLGQRPVVYLKSDNILGHKSGTKAKLHDSNGDRFSLVIDGKWYGYYSEDTFETQSSRLTKEYAGVAILIASIITSYLIF